MRVAQENDAQKAKAVSDFYEGKPDESLFSDADYYDTYRSLLAAKNGDEAATEFAKFYRETWLPQNPTGDLAGAREGWIKQNLTGSEDKEYEAQVLAQFVKSTDPLIGQQTETAVKTIIANGKQNLLSVIAADAKNGDITPDRIAFYTESYRRIDPANAYEAAPAIAAGLAVAVQNNPDKANAILGTLSKPGTGVNGKSFADSFPDAYADLQDKAVTSWQSTNTMEEWNAVDGLKQRAAKFYSMSDDELHQFGADLVVTRNKYGAANDIQQIQEQLGREYERRAKVGASNAQVDAMLLGATPKDPDVLKKGINADYLKEKLGTDNIFQADPGKVAEIFVRSGGAVSDDYKLQLSDALTQFENPKAQMAALQILDQVQRQRDVKFADQFLNDTASRYFHQVAADMDVTNDGFDKAVERVNNIRRQTAGKDITWADVTGKRPEEAKTAVASAIKSAVTENLGASGWFGTGLFGTTINVPVGLQQDISDYALHVALERGGQGVDYNTAINEAVKRIITRAEVLPQNGRYVLNLDTDRPPVWVGADGQVHPRTRLGLQVYNPDTGESVDTTAVYEKELVQLGRSPLRVLLPGDGTTKDVSLQADPYSSSVGAYRVMKNGNDVIYEVGKSYEIEVPKEFDPRKPWFDSLGSEKRTITFPATPEGMMEEFADLPKGFGFIPVPLTPDFSGKSGTGWALVYRPNFGDSDVKTLEEREKEFRLKAPSPEGGFEGLGGDTSPDDDPMSHGVLQ
jgi:hypothetical protein